MPLPLHNVTTLTEAFRRAVLVAVPVYWTSGRLNQAALSRERLTDLGRGSMAVRFDEPLTVVRRDEFPNHRSRFLKRLESCR